MKSSGPAPAAGASSCGALRATAASCASTDRHRHSRRIDPIDRLVGVHIRQRRLRLHMSTADLAKALGVATRLIERHEDGASRVPAHRLQLLAKLLLVPVDFFFGQTSSLASNAFNSQTPRYILDYLADADGLELAKAFVRISSGDTRRAIVRLVERLGNSDGREFVETGARKLGLDRQLNWTSFV
jgi:transcriptional regulator with XRE-family HTH domain